MRVVAWYLPGFRTRPSTCAARSPRSGSRPRAGGRFDGFALDIESSAVKRPALRTRRVIALSRQLRAAVGRGYALGAIIPAPRGMEQAPKYWPDFPYAQLAGIYDVFLPMVYWTFSVKGPDGTYGYLAWSLAILRAETGNPRLADPPGRGHDGPREARRGRGLRAGRARRRPARRVEPLRLVRDETRRLADPRGSG